MIFNPNINQIKKAIEKQYQYLLVDYHFRDNCPFGDKKNYSFNITSSNFLHVRVTLEERSSGSCWDEHLWEPNHYKFKSSDVKRVIRIALSSILPRNKKSELNILVLKIFNEMKVRKYTDYEYYGNYSTYKIYEIDVLKIIEMTKTHFNIH